MSDCKDIAEIIADYRYEDRKSGALGISIDKSHVEKWIDQFPENQDIILRKTKKLLDNFYYSQAQTYAFLKMVAMYNEWGDPKDIMEKAYFLDCQTEGHSQHSLLDMMEQVVQECYHVQIKRTNRAVEGEALYLYLDDGLFSGKTLVQDMQSLIPDIQEGSEIIAIFMVCYSFGAWWANRRVEEMFGKKQLYFRFLYQRHLENSSGTKYPFDCLRPTKYQSDALDRYIEILEAEHQRTPKKKLLLYRDSSLPKSELFGSEEKRLVLEKGLMEAGLKIYNLAQNQAEYMRPMGFDNRISLGFGAFFSTFMNMANNCPLAYWWGDPGAGEWHPFSRWYPLLPRRAHDNTGYCSW